MEAIQLPRQSNRRSFLGTLALGILLALSGCDTTKPFFETEALATSDTACQVMALWQSSIATTEDSEHNGKRLTGIAGRVYLLGMDGGTPVVGDGELVVSLMHEVPRTGASGPVEVYQWKFDPVTLKRLQKKDMIGWGYTLFLPWPEHMPVFSQIQLKVRYNQPNRSPLFNTGDPFTLDPPQGSNQLPQVTHAARPRGQ